MKKLLFALLMFCVLSCSEDSVIVNDASNQEILESSASAARGAVYHCNSFTVNTLTVSIGVLSADVTLGKPLTVYVCCGPAFWSYGGCAPVTRSLYNALNGTSSSEKSIPIGVPISEIVDDPLIKLNEITSVNVVETSVTDGQRVISKKYPVDNKGYVYFELEEVK
jgi:hypothetical protein